VGRGQREDAPIATALEAMIAYDGVTRTEPAMKPPMVINPWARWIHSCRILESVT
jgi:hypothetical protein